MRYVKVCLCGQKFAGNIPDGLMAQFDKSWAERHKGDGHGAPEEAQRVQMEAEAEKERDARHAREDAELDAQEAANRQRGIQLAKDREAFRKRTGQ